MKTIILNHKSYLSYEEIKTYKNTLEKLNPKNIELVLMPNIAYLSMFTNYKIKLGSQNFYSYNFGSYTGEISLETLKSLKVTYTLVGHPERILLKLDSYEEIKDKLFRSINSGFKTVLCIGHDEKEKTIKKELKYYLKGVEQKALENLIIAFEPSSKIESNYIDIEEIEYFTNVIRKYLTKHYDINIPIIYGGSVNKENIKEVLNFTDGVILGKYSTNIKEIEEVIKNIDYEK